MDNMHAYTSQESNFLFTLDKKEIDPLYGSASEEIRVADSETDKGETKNTSKDRSSGKYSEEDFKSLPRNEQLALAKKYWGEAGASKIFDDGTFQFSYTQFTTLCKKLGFEKGIIDTLNPEQIKDASGDTPGRIYISRSTRAETVEKKYTFSKSTIDMIDSLLDGCGNINKSKALDAILSDALSKMLALKSDGKFGVFYPSSGEEKII